MQMMKSDIDDNITDAAHIPIIINSCKVKRCKIHMRFWVLMKHGK